MIDEKTLLHLRPHLQIAHHIPGRIRLRFAFGILQVLPKLSADQGEALLAGLEGIHDVRFNAAALSILIQYDPMRLAPALWEKLITGSDREAAEAVKHFQPRIDSASP
jgi:hypothetical protein